MVVGLVCRLAHHGIELFRRERHGIALFPRCMALELRLFEFGLVAVVRVQLEVTFRLHGQRLMEEGIVVTVAVLELDGSVVMAVVLAMMAMERAIALEMERPVLVECTELMELFERTGE